MPNEYWVEAELSECRESRGHCYMSLIQKDEKGATPIAKADAKCWASKWMMIRPYFERTTGQRLHPGMKVLLKVYAQFHEAFGFSWIVTDIDPTYTLGDMARKRQEIIRQLKEEGVFDLQKELSLPVFCQRIAVISSETAACRKSCRSLYSASASPSSPARRQQAMATFAINSQRIPMVFSSVPGYSQPRCRARR